MKYPQIYLLMATLLSACETNEITQQQAVDSDIQVEPKELLTPQGHVLVLDCKTEKIYGCSNYFLSHVLNWNEQDVDVTFLDVPEIGLCLTALGPATASIGLGNITNTGEYEISLNNGSVKNKGTLTLTATDIILDLESENGIEILRKITKRIPRHTYWGTVGYAADSLSAKAISFLNELENLNEIMAFNQQVPGVYSYYEINQNGEIEADSPSGYHFTEYFIFQYDGDNKEEFKNQLEALSTSYSDKLTINFQNSKGESIYNWD